jgi:hypothetical protein
MIAELPERFAALAANVQTLDVGRLHGINIVHEEFNGSEYIFFRFFVKGRRCIFDVIAYFTNLEVLSIYMKNWWGNLGLNTSGNALPSATLRSLRLGGHMSMHVLLQLLDEPTELKHLTLINLIETPGQAHDGITFVSRVCDRFNKLETLHLCKLADLDGRLEEDEDEPGNESDEEYEREYASGMRWRFPRESEVAVLEDWSLLLRHTSKTLRELTLENRYLCSYNLCVGGVVNPDDTHPADYGAFSIRECQRMLFPEFLSQEWPKLEKLTLVGMGTIEGVSLAVSHLEPQVHIEQRPATIETMVGDATPEKISTPVELANII